MIPPYLRCLAWLVLLLASTASARPDPDAVLGETLVERGSAFYRFEHFELDSRDGQRHYRVRLAIPRRPPPADGYPALYLLDGNAVLQALREDWLAELDAAEPPLLVLIGPASDRRLDLPARTRDYTPGWPDGRPLQRYGEHDGGGSSAFRELLEQRIRPAVAARQPLDASRQAIWGHSFGGLFVLDTLFAAPTSFQTYIAASPSLWWQPGLLAELERSYRGGAQANLLLLRGGEEGTATRDAAGDSPRARAMATLSDDALQRLAERLGGHDGLEVTYRELPGLGHGPMLAVSLHLALRLAAGLPIRG